MILAGFLIGFYCGGWFYTFYWGLWAVFNEDNLPTEELKALARTPKVRAEAVSRLAFASMAWPITCLRMLRVKHWTEL